MRKTGITILAKNDAYLFFNDEQKFLSAFNIYSPLAKSIAFFYPSLNSPFFPFYLMLYFSLERYIIYDFNSRVNSAYSKTQRIRLSQLNFFFYFVNVSYSFFNLSASTSRLGLSLMTMPLISKSQKARASPL